MMTTIAKANKLPQKANHIVLVRKKDNLKNIGLTNPEIAFVRQSISNGDKQILINKYGYWIIILIIEYKKIDYKSLEKARLAGNDILSEINKKKLKQIYIVDSAVGADITLAFAEGLALSNYQFLKYFKDKDKKQNTLKKISVISKGLSSADIKSLNYVLEAVCLARDLVNEPLSFLTAVQLSEEIKKAGDLAGFSVEIFGKKKIESLKMGGVLAVNRGSEDPPTFSVLSWNPENAKNKKPYILVGKGVVFDTGGLSLKPTAGSMDSMKSDMAGAAAVVGAMYAMAKANLPVHVIALVPATDNRPGKNAYAPQDVVKMHSGLTVEVLNTDAEGRMLLADALSYAKKYKPQLVIDLATLTGAAVVAVGTIAIAGMGTADSKVFNKLKKCGDKVFERIVELPVWEEYDKDIESSVADIKNIGGRYGGAITAGKFLQHFTDYPWIHLDIAGPAYLDSQNGYRPKGGTAVGVRLLFDFFNSI